MSRAEVNERLSRISTDWDVLRDAHGGADAARAAQALLLLRYGPAVRRYLMKVAGDADAADELFQVFGVAVIEGKLKSAAPDRGRFRDYVKAVLRNLVADYRKKQRRAPQPVGDRAEVLDVATPEADEPLDEAWRDNLLTRAWAALADANRTAYEVLRARADHPKLASHDLAAQLTARLGKPLTPEAVRQMIHRARKQFAFFLVEEVGLSLAEPTADAVAQELAELGLLEYCRPALEE